MITRFTLIVFICANACLVPLNLQAQEDVHKHDHDPVEGDAHHHHNEISVAAGLVPLIAEDELTWGIHLHYIRGIDKKGKVGVGIGLETIIDEHKHYTVSAVLHYRIVKGLIFSLAPGLLILKQDDEFVYQYAQHIELAYEFEVGEFHIGPVVELGLERVGVHYLGGVHFGIDF